MTSNIQCVAATPQRVNENSETAPRRITFHILYAQRGHVVFRQYQPKFGVPFRRNRAYFPPLLLDACSNEQIVAQNIANLIVQRQFFWSIRVAQGVTTGEISSVPSRQITELVCDAPASPDTRLHDLRFR